jgi:hypothetical protein
MQALHGHVVGQDEAVANLGWGVTVLVYSGERFGLLS